MEVDQLNPLAVTHLLQHTLRSLCIHENSQWVYAVFWRILPRNYPPPKWDIHGGAYDRSRGNRRNWILVWEDGFCNFAASSSAGISAGDYPGSSVYGNCEYQQYRGLQPELFFKMSHEIYNYGEGLIGKVAADHSHKWIFKEPTDQETNFLSAWQNSADSQPRTWEAQFQSGIKTIALIAVREGVIQLGAVHKVMEDLSYVVLLRKKFGYIESIPGVLLPHPSSSDYPYKIDGYCSPDTWHFPGNMPPQTDLFYDHFNHPIMKTVTPSMSSLEALLSKLPSVVPPGQPTTAYGEAQPQYLPPDRVMGMQKVVAKEEVEEEEAEEEERQEREVGESSSATSSYHGGGGGFHHFGYHHDLNISSGGMPNNGY